MNSKPIKAEPNPNEVGYQTATTAIDSEHSNKETAIDRTGASTNAPVACMMSTQEHELVALGAQKPKDNAPPNATDNPIEAPVATASTENERSMLGDHDDLGIANESKLVQVKEESPSPGGLTEKDADGAGASAGEKDNDADRDEEDATKELMRILADPTLIGLSDRAVPTTRQAFKAFKPDSKYTSYSVARVIGTYLVNLKNGKALTKDQSQAVYDVLKSISQIEGLNNVDAKNLDIHRILPGVMGESTQEKPYAFPAPFPELAAMLNERIELNSAFEEDIEIQAAAPAANSAASTDSRTSKKRKLGKSPISQEVPTPTLDRRNPAVRDYLYNVERAGKKGKSWKIIDHKKNRASYKKFGHNGLTIGQCWPLCICMLRDGVHGSTQGGISGTEAGGARSIVISGGYEDMDNDLGDVVVYSGSGSHNNTVPDEPQWTPGNKAMKRSYEDKKAIRVIRSNKGASNFSPAAGFRYDGLYLIEDMDTTAKNKNGGAYVRFTLKRRDDQDPIPVNRPTQAEKDAFRTLRDLA